MTMQHPTIDQLRSFASGQAIDPQDWFETHLNECETCLQLAAAKTIPDSFESLMATALRRIDRERKALSTLAFDGQPTLDEALPMPPAELADHPRYKLKRLLGQGGMGAVWLAEHTVMNRLVALKVIRATSLARSGSLARFHREMQAVAKLNHPNIATAYDADCAEGLNFLVMEYVPGEVLSDVVSRGPLSVADACRAIRDAALGLSHAHAAGLIHRDVKPGNLIRTPDGTVKLLDFGLVSLAEQPIEVEDRVALEAPEPGITATNQVMGTADYLAPEQAGDPRAADVRSDLYSLGCTLYHLLAGRVPYPEPSLAAKLHAHGDPMKSPAPIAGVPLKLQAVLAKLLPKAPADRYVSAQEVVQAISPFCATARPRQDRRSWLAAGLLALFLLAAGVVYRIKTETGELLIETVDADIEVVVKQDGKVVTIFDPKSKNRITLKSGTYEFELNGQPTGLKLDIEKATLHRGDTVVAKIVQVPGKVVAARIGEVLKYPGITEYVLSTAVSSDGRLVAMAGGSDTKGSDHTVRIYETMTGKLLQRFQGHDTIPTGLAFNADGTRLVSTSKNKSIRLWDVATGRQISSITPEHPTHDLRFLPGPKERIIACSDDAAVRIWDVKTGTVESLWSDLTGERRTLSTLALSPNGKYVLVGGWNVMAEFEIATGQLMRKFVILEASRAWKVDYSTDGTRVLGCIAWDGLPIAARVRVWNAATGEPLWETAANVGAFQTANGARIFTAGISDFNLTLWDIPGRREVTRFSGHANTIYTMAIAPDGLHAVTGGFDNTARLWQLPDPNDR